jgi:hypothetical protein
LELKYKFHLGFRVQGSGFKVQGSKVQGSKVQGSKVQGSKVQGSKVQGSRFRGSGSFKSEIQNPKSKLSSDD